MATKMKHAIVIHYSEIALKGQNRSNFEKILLANINKKLEREEYEKIEKKLSRILVRLNKNESAERICDKLKQVFGIKWLSPAFAIEKNLEILEKEIIKAAAPYKEKTIKIETKRADKNFPITSLEISKRLATILEKNGFKMELKKTEVRIFVEVLNDEIIIAYKRIEGKGGLPLGCSGKVLCLFSGGIDSPVAAWLMMRRGCSTDLLHVHSFPSLENIRESKIEKIRKKLEEYSPNSIKLYAVPYDEFYANAVSFPEREEAVLFRRFIVKVANKIAEKEGYLGLVMGDNIGQVASQTLENIAVVDEASKIPIYRPLLTMSKEEIIRLAQKIGTYEASIEKYKDCCSLVAPKHPATKVNKKKIELAEKKADINKIVEKTLEKIEII